MGFNKKYIKKSGILENISNLETYLKADMFIMDYWSSRFCNDLNPKERKLREKFNEDTMCVSSPSTITKHKYYEKFNSRSEMLINLMTNPQWTDILISIDKFKIPVKEDERGRMDILKEKAIKHIIDYYECGS